MPHPPYHHGNLRSALLDAALGLLRERGAADLTLRDVARRAGVSHAAPYHHFADKAALVAAVAEEGFRALAATMRERMESCGEHPRLRLQAAGIAYVVFAVENPALFRVMFGPEREDPHAHADLFETTTEGYRLLVAAIDSCREAGVVRCGDSGELSRVAWALVHGLALLILDGPLQPGGATRRRTAEALARRATAWLITGFAPYPASAEVPTVVR